MVRETIDIKKLEAEVNAEVRNEAHEKAKRQIKAKLVAIKSAEQILLNLRREYDDLCASIVDGTN